MKRFLFITTMLLFFLTSAQVEARLPFSNLEYNSMSLRPLNLLETSFAVRFYINIGGSVDRIITLKADSIKRDLDNPDSTTAILLSGTIQQIGQLFYESNDSSIFFYNEIHLDYFQVDSLLKKVIDLDLTQFQSRKTKTVILHKPNSLFTIEIKKNDQYHTFYFSTMYPTEESEDSEYGILQDQIFQIFPSILEQIKKTSYNKK